MEVEPDPAAQVTIGLLRKLVKKSATLRKSFKRGQSFTIPPSTEPTVISVTKGKSHLSFSGPVEWGKAKQ